MRKTCKSESNINTLENQIFILIWCLLIVYFIEVPLLHNELLTRFIWMPAMGLLMVMNAIQFFSDHSMRLSYLIPLAVIVAIIVCEIVWYQLYADFDTLFSVALFLNMLLLIIQSDKFRITEQTKRIIFSCNALIVFIFLVYTQLPVAHQVTNRGVTRYIKYFCFNLNNTNAAGMLLYCFFSLFLIGSPLKKHRIINTLLLVLCFWLIYKTGSRTCIIAALFVIGVLLLPQKRIPNFFITLCTIFPTFFVYLYLKLYFSGFQDFIIAGQEDKPFFSGREVTFSQYLSQIQGLGQALFGNLRACPFSNAHNSGLAIFCSIGVVGLIATLYILSHKLKELNYKNTSKTSYVAIACILGVFVQTCGEASFLLGGFPAIPFLFMLFLLAGESS